MEEVNDSSGVVLESAGGIYSVLPEGGRRGEAVEAFLRGRLKRQSRTGARVVAGDRVRMSHAGQGEGWVIEEVEERKSELVRAAPGGRRPKAVAANLDQVLVVMSVSRPPFRLELADRYLVLAESCGIPAVLVLNKMDLVEDFDGDPESVFGMYRSVGYPVIESSAVTGDGLAALSRRMEGRVSTLIGPSGAGKSSLLNALYPDLDLKTAAVSRRGGRGTHTTVNARMLVLDGETRVVDTPGFSDVAAWGVDPGTLATCFPEFLQVRDRCRFRGCSHLHEPDCGVVQAVAAGAIDPRRYESYRVLADAADEAGGATARGG